MVDNDNKIPRFNTMHPCTVVDVESVGGDTEELRKGQGHRARFWILGDRVLCCREGGRFQDRINLGSGANKVDRPVEHARPFWILS